MTITLQGKLFSCPPGAFWSNPHKIEPVGCGAYEIITPEISWDFLPESTGRSLADGVRRQRFWRNLFDLWMLEIGCGLIHLDRCSILADHSDLLGEMTDLHPLLREHITTKFSLSNAGSPWKHLLYRLPGLHWLGSKRG